VVDGEKTEVSQVVSENLVDNLLLVGRRWCTDNDGRGVAVGPPRRHGNGETGAIGQFALTG
jgi:hypothetical protein